MKINHNN